MSKKKYIVEVGVKGTVFMPQDAVSADEALDKVGEKKIIEVNKDALDHDIDITLDDVEEEK